MQGIESYIKQNVKLAPTTITNGGSTTGIEPEYYTTPDEFYKHVIQSVKQLYQSELWGCIHEFYLNDFSTDQGKQLRAGTNLFVENCGYDEKVFLRSLRIEKNIIKLNIPIKGNFTLSALRMAGVHEELLQKGKQQLLEYGYKDFSEFSTKSM